MKQSLKSEVNAFTKGLITEASDLAFPANASLQEENFVLTPQGIRKRRKGLQYEAGGSYGPVSQIGSKINGTYLWKAPNGDTSKEFLVVSFRQSLYFYDNSFTPLSSGYITSLSISSLGDFVNPFLDSRFSVALTAIDGRLIVAVGGKSIGVVSYDGTTFSLSTGKLLVRDLWGVEETSDIETDPSIRPTTLTDAHYYNLQNQSWGIPRKGSNIFMQDPVDIFHAEYTTEYPSNTDSMWTGLQYTPVTGTDDPYEKVFPKLYKESYNGGLPAAKGYYIIDFLDRGLSRETQFLANKAKYPAEIVLKSSVNLPDDQSERGAILLKAYAGRVFYGGFSKGNSNSDARSPTLSNYLAFSQVIKSKNDIFKCYQEGDPTSRENADVVDTDGGFIKIADTNVIIAFEVYRESLIIFGDEGVWSLSGGGDYGFSASNYKLNKLSDKECTSPNSIVSVGGDLMFWAKDGIYIITKNQFGDTVVNSMTVSTIQNLYNSLSYSAKYTVVGCYSQKDKLVKWLYTENGVTQELCFDVAFSAFTKNRFYGLPSTRRLSWVFTKDAREEPLYIVVEPFLEGDHYRFCTLSSEDFLDFTEDAKAFLQTGDQTVNDSSSTKQLPYLIMHFRRTEDGINEEGIPLKQSGCLAQVRWSWSILDESNKWSRLFQAYRERKPLFSDTDFVSGFKIVTSKSKVRGSGRVFSLYFETEPGKDCQPLGWNLSINGNQYT